MRRSRPLAEPARAAALELERAESEIALLDRVRPQNGVAEQARLTLELRAGRKSPPAFVYAPAPALASLRGRLAELAALLDRTDAEQALLAERAHELELEAALVEQVARPGFAALAARRFALPDDGGRARRTAEQFVSAGASGPALPLAAWHLSHDARDPSSLWSEVARLIAREGFRVRVEAVPGLSSLAAVGDGVVRVRPGARLGAEVARRIALHEVFGHVRPRVLGRRLGGVFAAGAAGGAEDEEGRAILLEERAGLLDPARRAELGRRYLAAESVRGGAGLWDTVELLGRRGATLEGAVELACRVHRGGGLGRELIYLTGYLRVSSELARRPELERVLEAGRLSLAAAEALLSGSIELDHDGDVI